MESPGPCVAVGIGSLRRYDSEYSRNHCVVLLIDYSGVAHMIFRWVSGLSLAIGTSGFRR